MRERPPACSQCPAALKGRGFVPGVGPAHPKLIVVGQGPGRQEAVFGEPFIGPAGSKLDRWLSRATPWQRGDLYITNTVWCWLPGDRPPTPGEVDYCRAHHWAAPLADRLHGGTVPILALGVPAGKALVGDHYSERWNGSLQQVDLQLPTDGEE